MSALCNASFENLSKWKAALQTLDIADERHVRIATEGALLGSLLEHGFNKELVIVSDDAGQFNVLLHALCWIHAERSINKLVGLNSKDAQEIEEVRGKVWDFYAALKHYKKAPSKQDKVLLENRFDELFTAKTSCVSLKLALQRLYKLPPSLLFCPHQGFHIGWQTEYLSQSCWFRSPAQWRCLYRQEDQKRLCGLGVS